MSAQEESKKNTFIMSPKVDFCFKKLMENEIVRRGFTAALLHRDPDELDRVDILPGDLSGDYPEEKLGILDVHVQLQDGTQLDMEMQVSYFKYWTKRLLLYLARMYTRQIQEGDSYNVLQKCIHVSILDFVHFSNDPNCYRIIHLKDESTNHTYTDLFELQFLELPKLTDSVIPNSQAPSDNASVYEWMKFFNVTTREEFHAMSETKNVYVQEAVKELERLSADEKERLAYEARLKAIMDYHSNMTGSFEEGIKTGETRLAQLIERLLSDGKIEEIKLVSHDSAARKKYYALYGITSPMNSTD